MEQYRPSKNDILSMLDNLDVLEEKLIARVIYWSQESKKKPTTKWIKVMTKHICHVKTSQCAKN